MKMIWILPPVVLVTSCTDRPLIYTGSNFGVHANGLQSEVPEKLSLGYERSEFVWLPRGGASSVRGTYDAEYRFPAHVAISEMLITGRAATKEPEWPTNPEDVEAEETRGKDSDLVLSTNTRMNLGIEGAPVDGPGFSFNFGFKRAVLALFPRPSQEPADGELASTYTDLSVHARGFGKFSEPKGIAASRHLSSKSGGARTVQTIATGRAACLIAEKEDKRLVERIAGDLGATVTEPANPNLVPAPPMDDAGGITAEENQDETFENPGS